MFERHITEEDVSTVLNNGIIIEDYPNDTPYPSRLILGWCGGRPVHTVVAYNAEDDEDIIVTVYEPESTLWTPDFERRKL
jgi:hypothetical protein